MHIGVDQGSGLICKLQMTTAKIHDRRVFSPLVSGGEKAVYADKGYSGYLTRVGASGGLPQQNKEADYDKFSTGVQAAQSAEFRCDTKEK